jgi:hypothetical protein
MFTTDFSQVDAFVEMVSANAANGAINSSNLIAK